LGGYLWEDLYSIFMFSLSFEFERNESWVVGFEGHVRLIGR